MLLVDLFGWWYTKGWVWISHLLFVKKNSSIVEFFSIGDLLRTLFAPFRQDSINVKGAPIGLRLQALGGNIISRIFGLIIRTALIFLGLISLLIHTTVSLLAVIAWPLAPMAPVISVFLLVRSAV